MPVAELVSVEIAAAEQVKKFVLAGNATFTLQSKATGKRFTYTVKQKKANEDEETPHADLTLPHFVKVLTGPENTTDYTFLGTVFDGAVYRHGKKSAIGIDAPSAKVFTWFFERIAAGQLHPQMSFYHLGKCGRCNRPLTDPKSIESGFGPVCRGEA